MLIGSRSLFDSIIHVTVGPDQVNFQIHKTLLCQQPGYFRKVLSSGMKEAIGEVIYLDEDDPTVFSLFMVWLYTGRLLTDEEILEKKQIWADLAGLGVFAEVRGLPYLHDAVISGMVRVYELLGSLPDETIVQQTWDNTPENSILRAFLCGLFARKADINTYLNPERLDVLSKEFLAGIMRELYKCTMLFRRSGDSRMPLERCSYHHHDSGTCQDPKEVRFKSKLPIYGEKRSKTVDPS